MPSKPECTEEMFHSILREIEKGDFPERICKENPHFCTINNFKKYVKSRYEAQQALNVSRAICYDLMAMRIINIADQFEKNIEVTASEVAAAKMQIDARKWILSKLAPEKYGDSVKVDHSGGVQIHSITRKVIDAANVIDMATSEVLKLRQADSDADSVEGE